MTLRLDIVQGITQHQLEMGLASVCTIDTVESRNSGWNKGSSYRQEEYWYHILWCSECIWQGKDRERGVHRECIHTQGPLKREWTG